MSQKGSVTCNNRYTVLSGMDYDNCGVWTVMDKEHEPKTVGTRHELKIDLIRSSSDGSGSSERFGPSQQKRRLNRYYSTPSSFQLSYEKPSHEHHGKHPKASHMKFSKAVNFSTESFSQGELKARNKTQSFGEKVTEKRSCTSDITPGSTSNAEIENKKEKRRKNLKVVLNLPPKEETTPKSRTKRSPNRPCRIPLITPTTTPSASLMPGLTRIPYQLRVYSWNRRARDWFRESRTYQCCYSLLENPVMAFFAGLATSVLFILLEKVLFPESCS